MGPGTASGATSPSRGVVGRKGRKSDGHEGAELGREDEGLDLQRMESKGKRRKRKRRQGPERERQREEGPRRLEPDLERVREQDQVPPAV